MFIKTFLILLFFLVSSISGKSLEYTYDNLAGGWLKYHKASSWIEASIICDTEGSVLASPLNSQLRDAIKDYMSGVGLSGATIMTGVQASFTTSDFYSIEGVPLNKMPVIIETGASGDRKNSKTCVKWMTGKAKVQYMDCDDNLPFVCYKKRKSWAIAGCGTPDPEYLYDERSGSCYKVHQKGLTWINAYKKCKKEGAYLAINNNQLENEVLKELFAKYPFSQMTSSAFKRAFMGIRDWLDGDSWKTVKGQNLEDAGFVGWATYEPNNLGGNEHCVSLYDYGQYNDENCNMSLVFICEKEPEIMYN